MSFLSKTKTIKDIVIRVGKTFIFAFISIVVVDTGTQLTISLSDATVALALVTAFVAVQNLFVSPVSTVGRSLSTFIQTFVATWAATGFEFTTAAVTAAVAAAVGAFVNFTVKTA